MPNLATIRKALAALVAAVAVLTAQGLVDGAVEHWATGILGALVVFVATYAAPRNAAPDDATPPTL